MKVMCLIVSFSLAANSVWANDSCGSLSGLSNEALLRALQLTLGLKEESALYRRCVREMERVTRYQADDQAYFSGGDFTDSAFRDRSNEVVSQISRDFPSITLERGAREQPEENPTMSLEQLRDPGFQSIGIYKN